MLQFYAIVASASAPSVRDRLQEIDHLGGVEYVLLSSRDTARRRQRATTDKGTSCAIALPRGERLYNGAVLALDESRAIVVRVAGEYPGSGYTRRLWPMPFVWAITPAICTGGYGSTARIFWSRWRGRKRTISPG